VITAEPLGLCAGPRAGQRVEGSFDTNLLTSYTVGVEITLTPEEEAQLSRVASLSGRDAEALVHEAISRLLAEDARFLEAVDKGFASLDRGEYLEHEEVGRRLEQLFQP